VVAQKIRAGTGACPYRGIADCEMRKRIENCGIEKIGYLHFSQFAFRLPQFVFSPFAIRLSQFLLVFAQKQGMHVERSNV
jgi:hypothetical protein